MPVGVSFEADRVRAMTILDLLEELVGPRVDEGPVSLR